MSRWSIVSLVSIITRQWLDAALRIIPIQSFLSVILHRTSILLLSSTDPSYASKLHVSWVLARLWAAVLRSLLRQLYRSWEWRSVAAVLTSSSPFPRESPTTGLKCCFWTPTHLSPAWLCVVSFSLSFHPRHNNSIHVDSKHPAIWQPPFSSEDWTEV